MVAGKHTMDSLPSISRTSVSRSLDEHVVWHLVLTAFLLGITVLGFSVLNSPPFYPTANLRSMMWALAFCAFSFLMGFIFCIPRATDAKKVSGTDDKSVEGDGSNFQVNTNLEEISDWLTKIVVGLGLIELKKMPDYLHQLSYWMAPSFCPPEASSLAQAASISSCIVLYFSSLGFLGGYLITRLFFAGAFARAQKQQKYSTDVRTASVPYSEVESTPVLSTGEESTSKRLKKYWQPDGINVNGDNEKKLVDWMKRNALSISLVSFILSSSFEPDRQRAIQELGIS